MAAEATTGG